MMNLWLVWCNMEKFGWYAIIQAYSLSCYTAFEMIQLGLLKFCPILWNYLHSNTVISFLIELWNWNKLPLCTYINTLHLKAIVNSALRLQVALTLRHQVTDSCNNPSFQTWKDKMDYLPLIYYLICKWVAFLFIHCLKQKSIEL